MLADTTFTMKSGPMGTSMFSRAGKYTNYQYVCFNPHQGEGREDETTGEEGAEDHQIKEQVQAEQKAAEDQLIMANTLNNKGTNAFTAAKPSDMNKTKKSTDDALNEEEVD